MFKVLNLNVFIIGERNPDGSYKIQNPTNVKYRELLVNLDDSNTPISVPPILLCESFWISVLIILIIIVYSIH